MTQQYDDETLRLHMGELTQDELRIARAAIRFAQAQQDAQHALVVQHYQHVANEWADMATSCHVWLRNIEDGISTSMVALANSQTMLEHCREVSEKPIPKPVGPG